MRELRILDWGLRILDIEFNNWRIMGRVKEITIKSDINSVM